MKWFFIKTFHQDHLHHLQFIQYPFLVNLDHLWKIKLAFEESFLILIDHFNPNYQVISPQFL